MATKKEYDFAFLWLGVICLAVSILLLGSGYEKKKSDIPDRQKRGANEVMRGYILLGGAALFFVLAGIMRAKHKL